MVIDHGQLSTGKALKGFGEHQILNRGGCGERPQSARRKPAGKFRKA